MLELNVCKCLMYSVIIWVKCTNRATLSKDLAHMGVLYKLKLCVDGVILVVISAIVNRK